MTSRSTPLATLVSQTAAVTGGLPCARNAQLWFSEQVADLEQAKAACRDCPLRQPCLAGALERAEPWGVWGGEIFENGRVIEQKRPRGRPVTSGSRRPVEARGGRPSETGGGRPVEAGVRSVARAS
jgi:WhiB family transcriptional regulator, redox-sensing transcriptional regulator